MQLFGFEKKTFWHLRYEKMRGKILLFLNIIKLINAKVLLSFRTLNLIAKPWILRLKTCILFIISDFVAGLLQRFPLICMGTNPVTILHLFYLASGVILACSKRYMI